jgi:hypothetical protein
MSVATSTINVLEKDGLEALRYVAPERLQIRATHGSYIDLRGLSLEPCRKSTSKNWRRSAASCAGCCSPP